MHNLVTCTCGKKLRYNAAIAGNRVKCPGCGQPLLLPGETHAAVPVVPQSASRAPATTKSAPAAPTAPAKRYPCAECGVLFPSSALTNSQGRVICRDCAATPEILDESPPEPPRKSRKVLVGAAIVGGLTLAIVAAGYSLAPKKPAPSPSNTAVASAGHRSSDPERNAAKQPSEPKPDASEESRDAQPSADEPKASEADTGGTAAKKPTDDALLATFMASRGEWDDLFWKYTQSEADKTVTDRLLGAKEFVGDGTVKDVRYPPPAVLNLWGYGAGAQAQESKERSAIIRLYCAGDGLPVSELKSRFGEPRSEQEIDNVAYLVYGSATVMYGSGGRYMGVAHFRPLAVPPDGEKQASASPDRVQVPEASTPAPPPQASKDAETADPKKSPPADLAPSEAPVEEVAAGAVRKYALKYVDFARGDSPFIQASAQYVRLGSEKPRSLRQEPRSLGRSVTYAGLRIGGKEVPALLQGSPGPLLYIDTNDDGSLADEKPLRPQQVIKSGSGGPAPCFGPVTIAAKDKSRSPIRLLLEIWSPTSKDVYFKMYPAGCCQGKVRIGNYEYSAAVADADLDGRFDGVMSATSTRGCDQFALDRNRNGRIDGYWSELQPLSRMFRTEDGYYSLKVESNGLAVSVGKVTPQLGTLEVGDAGVEVIVASDAIVTRLAGADGKWQLPVGKYRCFGVVLTKGDSSPVRYELSCSGKTGQLEKFEIDAGKTVSFKAGPPLLVKADVQKRTAGSGRIVSVGISVRDEAGVEYATGATANGQRMAPPGIRILDRAGKVLASGKFEYG